MDDKKRRIVYTLIGIPTTPTAAVVVDTMIIAIHIFLFFAFSLKINKDPFLLL